MCFHVIVLAEVFSTHATGKGFFSCMDPLMAPEITAVVKCAITNIARMSLVCFGQKIAFVLLDHSAAIDQCILLSCDSPCI